MSDVPPAQSDQNDEIPIEDKLNFIEQSENTLKSFIDQPNLPVELEKQANGMLYVLRACKKSPNILTESNIGDWRQFIEELVGSVRLHSADKTQDIEAAA